MTDISQFPVEDMADMFAYLDELRESGEINMYGASSYVAAEYDVARDEARLILSAWMGTFSDAAPLKRAEIALAEQSHA